MKKIILFLLLSLFLVVPQSAINAQPGTLDPGFGNAGLVMNFVASSNDKPNCAAIQSDGKILVGGNAYYDTVANKIGFVLARYNTNGTIDSSFNGTGKVVTAITGSTNARAYAIALLPNDKIILSGYANIGGKNKMAMVRYSANGIVDSTFGSNGIVTTAIGTLDDRSTSILLQANGKIVLAGISKSTPTVYDFAIARYDSIGALDSTFSNDGINTTSFNSNNAICNSVAIQQDGTYYLFGSVTNISTSYFAMARYLANGNLDASFGTNGFASYTPGNGFVNAGVKVIIQPDKKLLLYGNATFSGVSKMVVMRFDSSASALDMTFGASGIASVAFTTQAFGAYDMVLQADGKIVATGQLLNTTNYDFALVRLKANGTLDSTFGTNGRVITTFGANSDVPVAIAIQADQKIVVAGETTNSLNSITYFALARYYGNISNSIPAAEIGISDIRVYPNPLNQELHVTVSDNEFYELKLYDLSSRIYLLTTFTNSISVNTEKLATGMYFYEVRTKNGRSEKGKLIKQ